LEVWGEVVLPALQLPDLNITIKYSAT